MPGVSRQDLPSGSAGFLLVTLSRALQSEAKWTVRVLTVGLASRIKGKQKGFEDAKVGPPGG